VKAKGQGCGTLAVGQEAEVTDAHEALRKDVQQGAAQELISELPGYQFRNLEGARPLFPHSTSSSSNFVI
jgi:hypothetical protein